MQVNNVTPRTTHLDRIGWYDGPTQLGFAELAANSYEFIRSHLLSAASGG